MLYLSLVRAGYLESKVECLLWKVPDHRGKIAAPECKEALRSEIFVNGTMFQFNRRNRVSTFYGTLLYFKLLYATTSSLVDQTIFSGTYQQARGLQSAQQSETKDAER